jgi:regulator of protease activity HflC (stomatin/prohibitin superfamily)
MKEKLSREERQEQNAKKGVVIGLVVIFAVIILAISTTVITDGEVGVKKTLGNYDDDELGTGLKLYMPIISTIEKVNVKKENVKEHVSVPSEEGLMVELDASVIFRLKPDRASEIKQTVSGSIHETLIKPYIRNGIRDVASGYEAKSIYSDSGREEISNKLQIYLSSKLDENIIVEDVLLRDVKLPTRVTDSIERKIDAEQRAQAKEFELQSAVKDAEIEIARANGTATANEIIGDSISQEYIQYKFVEGLNDGNTEVIYVPTEGNIPIMEAGRFNMNRAVENPSTNNNTV